MFIYLELVVAPFCCVIMSVHRVMNKWPPTTVEHETLNLKVMDSCPILGARCGKSSNCSTEVERERNKNM